MFNDIPRVEKYFLLYKVFSTKIDIKSAIEIFETKTNDEFLSKITPILLECLHDPEILSSDKELFKLYNDLIQFELLSTCSLATITGFDWIIKFFKFTYAYYLRIVYDESIDDKQYLKNFSQDDLDTNKLISYSKNLRMLKNTALPMLANFKVFSDTIEVNRQEILENSESSVKDETENYLNYLEKYNLISNTIEKNIHTYTPFYDKFLNFIKEKF